MYWPECEVDDFGSEHEYRVCSDLAREYDLVGLGRDYCSFVMGSEADVVARW